MKQVKLLKTQEHPKGNIEKGSVYNWNENTGFYELKKNGQVISTINEVGVNTFKNLFKKL